MAIEHREPVSASFGRACVRRRRGWLLCASVLASGLPIAAHAQSGAPAALPTGGSVLAGQATIAQSGNTLDIHQTSDRAILDWSSFSVGEAARVRFDNGAGATLNRVSGTAASAIDGQLLASGSVYLINPNGIVIGAKGVVATGGTFVASTLDVPNAEFLAGGSLTFSGPSRAAVVNLGKVGALGGNVALIGAVVENHGSLTARDGTAGLIAGNTVLLRDRAHDGGGLFSVRYGDQGTRVANGGIIEAANVELRAQQGNVYALAGNRAGTINATGVRTDGGKVWLVSEGGTTEVAGTIRANGADGAPGAIETSGHLLHIGNSSIDAGGGTWLLDPEDLVVDATAASSINAALGGNTSVTLQTGAGGASAYGNGVTSGAGDILINAGLSWNTGATLTLDSYHGIAVNANIAVNGGGSVVFKTANGGDYAFASGASISFADGFSGQGLTINGTSFTLLRSWAELQGISNATGAFALAHNLPAASNLTQSPVTWLNALFTGLGNSIPLTIFSTKQSNLGLFGQIASGGTVRDLNLVDVNLQDWSVNSGSNVGPLTGRNYGTVLNVSAAGYIRIPQAYQVGGLVGVNRGVIRNATAKVDIIGYTRVGGLVGENDGSIVNGAAMGEAYGVSRVGGLVGTNGGSISDSFATGPVIGNGFYFSGTYQDTDKVPTPVIGGLVGENTGTIQRAFATGSVTGSDNVGGLVGVSTYGQAIENAYASGAVSGSSNVGGLIGNSNTTPIRNVYATGSVKGTNNVGGLVGYSTESTIDRAYAAGSMQGSRGAVGGIVGLEDTVTGASKITNSYWDADGTGIGFAVGTGTYGAGARGLLAADMKRAASFNGWDIDTTGGQATAWRIYEGSTAPLLKAFLQTASVSLSGPASATVVYDGNRATGAFETVVTTASGQAADAAKILGTSMIACSGGDASCTNAGTYSVRAGGLYSTQSGYDLIFSNATASLTITPRALAVTANDRTMVYGDALPNLTYTATGLVNGDTLSGALTTGASATASVGSYAIGQGTLTAGANYTLSFTGGSVTITPRALAVTANDRTMSYGDALPSLTYTAIGLVNGDTLSGALTTGASATASVGNYAIGQGTLAAGGNYMLSFNGGSVTITPRALTVTANDRTMSYGDALPSLTYTAIGLVNGDTLSGALTTGAGSTASVGNYAIGRGTLTANGNYSLNFTGGNLAITPRALTVTANDRTMTYGDALPSLTYVSSGLVNGDTLTGALATGASATASVGRYAIGQGTLSAGGNYSLSFTGGSVTITPRALTVTANDRTMTYGDALPSLTYVSSGLVNGDTLTGALSTGASATASVGSYVIGQGTLSAGGNYSLSFSGGSVTITPRALTVTANDRTMTYGDALPSLTYVSSGLVNGDTLGGALTTGASSTASVGNYAIGLGTLSAGGNYSLSFSGGSVTITPRALTVTANDRTMTYGDALPSLTYRANGLVNGDTLTGALSTGASATASVGSYVIGQGTLSANSNYVLSFTGANVTIMPRVLTVKANDQTMAYGDALPSLTYSANGLVNGDALSGALTTGAGSTVSVGNYAIGQGTLAASVNYVLNFAGGNVTVTPRVLTVTANDRMMTYGDVLPSLTYVSSGLVNGDTLTGALSTGASATASVGTYAIGQGTLAATSNYVLHFAGGSVTITPRALTVTAPDRTMTYGDALPPLAYTASGLINGDTLSGALSTAASATASVGSYAIGQGTLSAGGNYVLNFTGGNVTISPRALTVTANDGTMIYGGTLPTLTYTAAGLVNGDMLTGALATAASATASVGRYAIDQGSLSAGGNYVLRFTGGSVTIAPRALAVTANDQRIVYGDAVPNLTYIATGLVNGDTLSGALATGASAAAPVGNYAIGQGTLSASGNYSLNFTGGSVTIVPRVLTVTANDRAMVYGDPLPGLTYTASGLVNGDMLSGALATAASSTASVGSYAIGQGTLAAGGNYVLRFVGGTVAITPRALTITALDRTRTIGEEFELGTTAFIASGLVNGDRVDGVRLASAGVAAGALINTPYAISVADAVGAGLGNYAITYHNAPVGLINRLPYVRPTNMSMRTAVDPLPSAASLWQGGATATPSSMSGDLVQLGPGIFWRAAKPMTGLLPCTPIGSGVAGVHAPCARLAAGAGL